MSQTTLLRLMMLLSPSFPVGGFAYSSGLEQSVADGLVSDANDLGNWLEAVLASGPAWNDAVLLKATYATENVTDVASLALALAGSKQRHMETLNLGMAFVDAVKAARLPCPALPDEIAYPVAVGAIAAANDISAESAIAAYLHAFASNQIQCSIRLGITGQTGGLTLLASLEPLVAEIAANAASSGIDNLGSNTLVADMTSMRHETLALRIFRS